MMINEQSKDSKSSALTSFAGHSGCSPLQSTTLGYSGRTLQSTTLAHPPDRDFDYRHDDEEKHQGDDEDGDTTGDFLNELGLGRGTEDGDEEEDGDDLDGYSTSPSGTIAGSSSQPHFMSANSSYHGGGSSLAATTSASVSPSYATNTTTTTPFPNDAVHISDKRDYEDRCVRIIRDRVHAIKKKCTDGNNTTTATTPSQKEAVGLEGSSLVERYKWCCGNVRSWCNVAALGFVQRNLSHDTDDEVAITSKLDVLWRGDAFDTSSWGHEPDKRAKDTNKKGIPAQLAVLSQVTRSLEVSRRLPQQPRGGGGHTSPLNQSLPPPFLYPFFLADDEGTLSLNSVSIDDEIAKRDKLLTFPPVCNRRGIMPLLVTLLSPYPSSTSSACSSLLSNIVRLDLSSSEVDDLVIRLLTHGVYSTANNTTTTTTQSESRTKEVVACRGLLSTLSNLVEIDLSYNPFISYEGGQWLQGYVLGGIVSTRANTSSSINNSKGQTPGAAAGNVSSGGGGKNVAAPYIITSLFSPHYDLTTATTYIPNPYLVSIMLDGCDGIRKGTRRAITTALTSRSKTIVIPQK